MVPYSIRDGIQAPEQYAATHMPGFTIVATHKHPFDDYLWYVVAVTRVDGSAFDRYEQKAVSWLYNGSAPGFAHGHYEPIFVDGEEDMNARAWKEARVEAISRAWNKHLLRVKGL